MANGNNLILLLPSGKSLEDRTIEMFGKANITIERSNKRAIEVSIIGFPGITKALFAKPSSIPGLIIEGYGHIGITGTDMVLECPENVKSGRERRPLTRIAKLPYSRATNGVTRCVIFTRQSNPVSSVRDIQPDARIATEYPKSTERFLDSYGISAYLRKCSGSAETHVIAGAADYGVALMETGETFRANDLKPIGTVFKSSTILVAGTRILQDQTTEKRIRFLGEILCGTFEAEGKLYLVMNAEKTRLGEIKQILPSLKSPTIQPLSNPNLVSIATVVEENKVNELIFKLRDLGASDFITQQALAIV